MTRTADYLIIGGGVIGLNLAMQAKKRYPDSSVIVLEKEKDCGLHASGRNSGVLHAGFYYTADSLKAKFTRDGNKALTQYCLDKDLAINQCGKLVVAQNETELAGLDELLKRAERNGVELNSITEQEAKEIEPNIKTFERALFSPSTASVNPKEVVAAMLDDAKELGVEVIPDAKYLSKANNGVNTSQGVISAGYIINAAGLYADKIAKDFGFSQSYKIIPFKGLYLICDGPKDWLRTNIYPVPNLNNPFLGVHFTITAAKKIKIGPTAIPAFWRENYQGFSNFNFSEMLEILAQEAALWMKNEFGFRRLAQEELTKYYKPHMVHLAQSLANMDSSMKVHWGPPGIRAQLYDTKNKRLEMDFCFEGDDKSFHVLNAVSPAFTCSIPFTEYLFDEIEKLHA